MPVLTNLRRLFSGSTLSVEPPISEEIVLPAAPAMEVAPERMPMPENPAYEGPAWLNDEDILRDEGVYFGLSEARPDEVVSQIRHEFAKQTAELEQRIDEYNEKIGELNLFIEQYENLISELRYKTDQLTTRQRHEHQLPRTLIGLCLSMAMCVGTFFLIDETLSLSFAQNHWIAVGVFLAGMFSLFSRTSLFHETNTPITPRRLLEEIGLPLAASLFVLAQALKNQPVGQALALWLFIFFLFLLAGKLLLGNLMVLWSDWRAVGENHQMAREKRESTDRWDAESRELRQEIDRLRLQKWQIIPELNRNQADLTRLNARRDGLIKLFESEFNLARSLRDRLTYAQRQAILNQ